jgi:hypothetical protein
MTDGHSCRQFAEQLSKSSAPPNDAVKDFLRARNHLIERFSAAELIGAQSLSEGLCDGVWRRITNGSVHASAILSVVNWFEYVHFSG